jgi:hypothetical protein
VAWNVACCVPAPVPASRAVLWIFFHLPPPSPELKRHRRFPTLPTYRQRLEPRETGDYLGISAPIFASCSAPPPRSEIPVRPAPSTSNSRMIEIILITHKLLKNLSIRDSDGPMYPHRTTKGACLDSSSFSYLEFGMMFLFLFCFVFLENWDH